jgi:hypothetical protein
VALAYWFFSIQFRESLYCAYKLHPADAQLQSLVREECDTDNLSPWPDVSMVGEKMNHDEFMRRVLLLSPIDSTLKSVVEAAGERYLARTRQLDEYTRAMSITSYECGGLESVFKAILHARHWNTPLLAGFRHFLLKHIMFDSDPNLGHGALIQHLVPDDRIRILWIEFRDLLMTAMPSLIKD